MCHGPRPPLNPAPRPNPKPPFHPPQPNLPHHPILHHLRLTLPKNPTMNLSSHTPNHRNATAPRYEFKNHTTLHLRVHPNHKGQEPSPTRSTSPTPPALPAAHHPLKPQQQYTTHHQYNQNLQRSGTASGTFPLTSPHKNNYTTSYTSSTKTSTSRSSNLTTTTPPSWKPPTTFPLYSKPCSKAPSMNTPLPSPNSPAPDLPPPPPQNHQHSRV